MEQLYSEAAGKFLADRFVTGTCPRCGYSCVSSCGFCGGFRAVRVVRVVRVCLLRALLLFAGFRVVRVVRVSRRSRLLVAFCLFAPFFFEGARARALSSLPSSSLSL